jgi:galactose-6-phosphate isomerase
MPFLDVSDLLSDPDLGGTTFSVIRTLSGPPVGGLAQLTPTTIPNIVGSIQPATSTELLRMPDGERVGGAVTVRCKFVLIGGGIDPNSGLDRTADQVVFKGQQYTVQSVQDWSDYGAGYVEALCSKVGMR